jgi:tRNA splicing ligase
MLAFVQQHKKQVFGSKKNALAEAAQAVINANVIASGGGEKSKKEKKSVDEKEKAIRKVFGDRKNHKVPSKGKLKKADVVLGLF